MRDFDWQRGTLSRALRRLFAPLLPTLGALAPGGLILLLACRAFAAEAPCPAARPPHLDLPAVRAALAHGQPVTIVAIGSSSTEGTGASAPDRTYPAQLQAVLRAGWLGARVTVLNRGIGGQTVDAMVARLDADALAAQPALVILQTGTNEALRAVDPALFGAELDGGVRRLAASGSDVVLMDNQIAPRVTRMERHAAYDAVMADEAAARHVSLFSRTALMRAWQAADPPDGGMIGPDGLHHTDRGYACLAASLGRAILDATAPPVMAMSARGK